jgi:hypothetical protein
MTTHPSVFLSYAREDRKRVEEVYDSLKAEGFNPWMDSRDIMPGNDWSSVIGEAIRAADLILIFISRHSISKRGYVQTEIKGALSVLSELPEGAINLIPVRLDASNIPEPLQHIQAVELFEDGGWRKLLTSLKSHMKRRRVAAEPIRTLREQIRKNSEVATRRPSVFVAMPFAVEMEDVFYYGIQRAIDANGLKAIRIDKSVFTGDILEQIKRNISTSVAAVIELTGLNPNVHLELGYAWGKGIPCVLLLKDGGDLCFDVRGQKCLVYRTIKDLEMALTEELARLKENGSISIDLLDQPDPETS